MKIILNKKGFVHCDDGKRYPCLIVHQETDYTRILPRVYIQFLMERPEFIITRNITVNMDVVSFGSVS